MPIMQSPPGPETIVDGRRVLYFAGTGYLGLQGRPEVARAAAEAIERFGIGSATTRAWFGDTPPVVAVERLAAQWFGVESSFYYASGFMGNPILAGFLADRFDAAFCDASCHFSIREAMKAAGQPAVFFEHGDPDSLSQSLQKNLRPGERPLVATDGVFAVVGDLAPLNEYVLVLADYPGASLLVDDAHGVGVLGERGRGTLEYLGLQGDGAVPIFLSATLSKALGGFGGVVPGARTFIEQLKKTSPYFIGASGPAVPVAAATARAIELAMAEPELRTRLRKNAERLRAGLRRLGLDVADSPTPILGLRIGTGENMARIQKSLVERGILIAHAADYAGAGPGGVLRIAVFATHTDEMIDHFCQELAVVL